jgi:serine/threonine protein phosphatase 1
MATYAIADIHGNELGFNECLKKCNFDNKTDTLIVLGDICDGGRHVRQVIDRILKIRNRIIIQGNHDNPWALGWMQTGHELDVWWHQGGIHTAESYSMDYKNVPTSHIKLLKNALPYYIDMNNRIYVHGGFDPLIPIVNQPIEVLVWDRDLCCNYAPNNIIPGYNHVFVGHTTTQWFNNLTFPEESTYPATFNNLTMLDTGSGWNGKCTIMDVDTFECFQSDMNANKQNLIDELKVIEYGKY